MKEIQESYSELIESKKLKIFFFVLFSAVLGSIIYIYSYFFWPFLFALILYIALKPVYNLLIKYVKRRLLCSALIIFSIILFVIIPLFFILLMLADQAYDFYLYLQQQFNAGVFNEFFQNSVISNKILSYININQADLLQQVIDLLSKASLQLFSNVTSIISFSIMFVINLLFMLLILLFLFKDGDKLSIVFYKILPFPENIEREIVARLNKVIKVLFAGNLFIMMMQGMVVGTAFWVFGLKMPLLWATVTAVLSLIPAVGTAFVWIPAAIYLTATGSYLSAIIFGLWCLIGYLILENVVKSKLFGKRLNFHPLIFFFLLLGSINAFNLPGIIIGPVLLSLFISLWELYKLLEKYSALPSRNPGENNFSI